MVEELFASMKRWASKPRWLGSGYTRIAVELADLPGHPARVAARRHKTAVEEVLASKLAECGISAPEELAKQLVLLLEGTKILILIHGDTTYADSAAAAGRNLVKAYCTAGIES